jgi:hypothetical protein
MYYAIYKDTSGQWRWRFVAANGKIIGVSSESYFNKQDCLHAITLMKLSGSAPVYE